MSKKGYLDESEAVETLKALGVKEHDGKEVTADNFKRDELISLVKFYNDKKRKIVETPKKESLPPDEMVEITPLKNWMLHCPPQAIKKQLIKDVSTKVNKRFIDSLKIEKVI